MALADIMTALRRRTSRYLRSSRGNATMIATLSAIPIVGAAGMAIDYARISRVQEQIQYATDAATLFAAGAKTLGGTLQDKRNTRQQLATNYLNYALANVTDAEIVGAPKVIANDIAIDIEVKARVKGSFTNVFAALDDDAGGMEQGNGGSEAGTNGKTYGITVKSKASWKRPVKYICMLALHPTDPDALSVQGTADIDAKNCALQVNSRSNRALYQSGASSLKASSIDVTGSALGSNFTPVPSTGTAPVNDPLAAKFETDFQATWSGAPVRWDGRQGANYKQMSWSASGTYTLQPGRYRGGIEVKNSRDIILSPGIYFIENGSFNIQAQGNVSAPGGVTLVFLDVNSAGAIPTSPIYDSATRINVQAGGSLSIKAPASGAFAGLAMAQHPMSRPGAMENGSRTGSKENTVIGGGDVDLTGIIYFPKQKVNVTGSGNISQGSPVFAIVAELIYIYGNGQLYIGQAADFEAAGLPALPSTGNTENKISLQ